MIKLIATAITASMFSWCMANADTMSTEDCSPILKDVLAETVNINFKCDFESESKILAELGRGAWTKQCGISAPEGWYFSHDELNSTWTLAPSGGSYFSNFNFLVTFHKGFSQHSDDRMPFDEGTELYSAFPLGHTFEASELLSDIIVQISMLYEDGRGLVRGTSKILQRSPGRYQADFEIVDMVDPYPEAGEYIPTIWPSCEANEEMGVSTFKRACQAIVERTLMNDDLYYGDCERPLDY